MTTSSPHRQRGLALIVGLLILLLITIIGVTAMRSTTMEEHMAGNMQRRDASFQAAEAALRAGEKKLNAATLPAFNGTNGYYPASSPSQKPRWETINWSDPSAVIQYKGTLNHASASYFIERLPIAYGPAQSVNASAPATRLSGYRVTARGVDANGNAVVILQSTYKR